MEEAGTKEYSVADDWAKSPKGGQQLWRGRDQRAKRGVSVAQDPRTPVIGSRLEAGSVWGSAASRS